MTKTSKEIQKQIRQAMKAQGMKSGIAEVTALDSSCFRVNLNGVYFGIFDSLKNTFVD